MLWHLLRNSPAPLAADAHRPPPQISTLPQPTPHLPLPLPKLPHALHAPPHIKLCTRTHTAGPRAGNPRGFSSLRWHEIVVSAWNAGEPVQDQYRRAQLTNADVWALCTEEVLRVHRETDLVQHLALLDKRVGLVSFDRHWNKSALKMLKACLAGAPHTTKGKRTARRHRRFGATCSRQMARLRERRPLKLPKLESPDAQRIKQGAKAKVDLVTERNRTQKLTVCLRGFQCRCLAW
jgi:hypothetical protein